MSPLYDTSLSLWPLDAPFSLYTYKASERPELVAEHPESVV